MKYEIAQRIKQGLEIRNMKQIDLVNQTGIGKSSISTYLSGDYMPKQKNIYLMAKALNVSEAWLMGLDVEMERRDSTEGRVLTNDEEILLKAYDKLNLQGRNEANKRIHELTEIPRYLINNHLTPVAAHNDFAHYEEEQKLMKEDLDEL